MNKKVELKLKELKKKNPSCLVFFDKEKKMFIVRQKRNENK